MNANQHVGFEPARPPAAPAARPRFPSAAGLLCCLAVLGCVTACSRTGPDFGAVRAEVIERSGCDWARQIHVAVPSFLFTAVRMGTSIADFKLEPEVKAALQTMRGLRVAVCQRAGGSPDLPAMLEAADGALGRRGWEPVVRVLQRREMVAVYAPARLASEGPIELCVVVFDGDQLVLVSGRARLEPLAEIGLKHVAEARAKHLAGGPDAIGWGEGSQQ